MRSNNTCINKNLFKAVVYKYFIMILNCYLTISAFTLSINFLQSSACQVTNNGRVIKSKTILTSANKLTEIHDNRVELANVTDIFNGTFENRGELEITLNGTDQNNTSLSSEVVENNVNEENVTRKNNVTIEKKSFRYEKYVNTEKVEVERISFTFNYMEPGTKWCGAGNVADSYDDLGSEREVDACCRAHDFCPEYIEAGESKYNLTNDAFYTRLSCKCDEVFRQCLRATKRRTASNIGTVYFNLLGTKCFRNEYPTVKCVKRGGWLKRKCLEYTYNTNASKYYQWFDVSTY